ncbi:MAG: SRPBCC domain-containing protein, partial [Bradyrhizobium sp.]
MFAATIETEIMIAASPEEIWAVLTDFDAYPNWNPFIRRIGGSAVVGARLRTELTQSPGTKPMRFSPRVLAVEPART